MLQAPSSLQDRLAPAEEIFFGWPLRVFAAATLVGSAWIDDAPPLEIGATIIAAYVAVRVLTQFGSLAAAAPFERRPLRVLFAAFAIALLASAFAVVAVLVQRLSLSIAG